MINSFIRDPIFLTSHTIRELNNYCLSLVCTFATRLSTSTILRIVPSFVPREGLEPSHLSATDPKSAVTTNSTTKVYCVYEQVRTADFLNHNQALY